MFLLAVGGRRGRRCAGGWGAVCDDAAVDDDVINVTGSCRGGVFNAHFAGSRMSLVATLLITGLCGGLQTFSTMAFQSLGEWRERRTGRLVFYLAVTLALGWGGWAGLVMGG